MKMLVLFLDAFRHDLISEEHTPFLWNLAHEGTFANLNTLAGYHVEYSILAGALPTKHNVWTWYGLDPKHSSYAWTRNFRWFFSKLDKTFLSTPTRAFISYMTMLGRYSTGKTRLMKINQIPLHKLYKFNTTVDKSYIDHRSLPVPTFLDVLRTSGKKYLAYDYPIKSTHQRTTLHTSHGDDIQELENLRRSLRDHYDLRFAHVWNLDSIQHKYGTDSKETRTHLRKLDQAIKKLVTAARTKEPTTVLLFADHGMSYVDKDIDALAVLKPYGNKIEYFIGSTLVNFWTNDEHVKKEVRQKFEALNCYVYDEHNIEEIKIPYTRNIVGDLMIAVKPGYQFYPDYFRKDSHVKAMHGYTHKVPDQDGIFILHGEGVPAKKIKNAQLVDIAPTILKILDLPIPNTVDGIPRV